MKYEIKNIVIRKEDGVAVDQLLTLDVEYSNGSHSQHNKVIAVDADIKEEAVIFGAELEAILQEPKEITVEEVVVATKDKEVKEADVSAKIVEMESAKVSKVEEAVVLEEPIKE